MKSAKPLYTEGRKILVQGYSPKCGKSSLMCRILNAIDTESVALMYSPEDTFFKYYSVAYKALGKAIPYTHVLEGEDVSEYTHIIYKGFPQESDIDIIYYICPPLLEDVELGVIDNQGRLFRAKVLEALHVKYPTAQVHFLTEADARLKTDELYVLEEFDWMTLREIERTTLMGTELSELRLLMRDSSLTELNRIYNED